jgi:Mg2+/Co2+ transporter CorB
MRKSVGFIIMLWALSQFFSTSFVALDDAARESFKAVEAAAVVSQHQIQSQTMTE